MTIHVPFVLPLDEQAMLTSLLTQPHRHYHNINHVNDSLTEACNHANLAHQKFGYDSRLLGASTLMTYAIWYHDAVYNPYTLPKVNEYQSAELYLSRHFSKEEEDDCAEHVAMIIKATAFHAEGNIPEAYQQTDEVFDTVLKLMLDIDLSGLGKPFPIFAKNTWNIRKEYYNTSTMDYMKNSLKFFQALNQRESFYYTEYFKDLYHTKSKDNVNHEISILEDAIKMENVHYYVDYLTDAMRDLP